VTALQTVLPINDSIFEMELLALCNEAFQHPDLHGYATPMTHAANFAFNKVNDAATRQLKLRLRSGQVALRGAGDRPGEAE